MLRWWVVLLIGGCYWGGGSDAPPSTTADAPNGEPVLPAPDPSLPRLRRLSVREIVGAYADLLGETISSDELLAERGATNFDNGPALLMMQTDQAARLEAVAWAAADRVVKRREPRAFGACQTDADCRDALVAQLAPRVYRRPLTDKERTRLLSLYSDTSAQSTPDEGLRAVIAALFQSPSFLYREELGGKATPSGGLRLGPYEIASELSFFISGSTPDDALLAAAANGDLDTGAGRRAQATRLLATPAARVHWRSFLRQWLALDDLAETTKISPYSLPPSLLDAMNADLDHDIDHVLWESTGSLDELFSTHEAFAGASLGRVYGLTLTDPPTRVTLDDSRAGIMTRAGWLSVHAAPDNSAPIARGVFVLSALLCRSLPAPPAGITRFAPVTDTTKTTRERFALHVSNPQCMTCHQSIDGVGFGFEQFDAVGALRTTEGGETVDTSGSVNLDGKDLSFVGAAELGRDLRKSVEFRSCFVRQVFRFAMGAPENDATLPGLTKTASGYALTDRIDALALALVESEDFVTREVAR